MGLLRKRTIFHVEESLPDPEEIKLRFRRRVLTAAFFGFLLVLGAPVARDLRQVLRARTEGQRFAQLLLAARTQAAVARAPVSLSLAEDSHSWKWASHPAGENCKGEAPGTAAELVSEGTSWKIQGQLESEQPLAGRTLCWHPTRGLLLDSTPVGEGRLLVTLTVSGENPHAGVALVLVTRAGAELQTSSL